MDLYRTKHNKTNLQEKYDIPDAAKTWALEAIHTAWRRYKSQLKKDHYDTYVNDEIRIKKRPAYVPESQFKGLLKYWNSEAVQVRYFSKVQFVHIPNAY